MFERTGPYVQIADVGVAIAQDNRFVDLKIGLFPDAPIMPLLPRLVTNTLTPGDASPPQVARVLRAVTEESTS